MVLMDVRMPVMDGLEATRRITGDASLASTRVVILTTFDLDEYVHEALRAGASGFLLKDTLPVDLLDAVRVVAAGDALIAPQHHPPADRGVRPPARAGARPRGRAPRSTSSPSASGRCSSSSPRASRTPRSPTALYVSHATVKTHVSRLLMKLDARDRAQLVMIAYETGVVLPGRSAEPLLLARRHRNSTRCCPAPRRSCRRW